MLELVDLSSVYLRSPAARVYDVTQTEHNSIMCRKSRERYRISLRLTI